MKTCLKDGYALIAGKVGPDGVVALAEPDAPRRWKHLREGVNSAIVHSVEFLRELIREQVSHPEEKQRWTDEAMLFAVAPNTDGGAGEIIPFAEFRRLLGV